MAINLFHKQYQDLLFSHKGYFSLIIIPCLLLSVFTCILILLIYFRLGARLLTDVAGGLMLSPDKTLDFHAVGFLKQLKTGWNAK